ncbi:MAG: hypothetical protein IAF08_16105, partial [Rhizobacter sp.]|nr:hypothetical protein [Chlorobiales bacterium]
NLSFSTFGAGGAGGDKLRSPQGVCYVSGALYVADTGNNRIVKFVIYSDIQ